MVDRSRELAVRFAVSVALLTMAAAIPAQSSTSFASFQAWLGTSTVFLDGFESASSCPWSAVQPPDADTCSNGLEDGCETDIDCGGRSCGGCEDFENCLVDGDCQSAICSNGICAQCLKPANCPGVDTDCAFRTCTALTCGTGYTPAGTETSAQTFGDCQVNVCDGSGEPGDVPDNSDIPDDGNQCTAESCSGGVPTFDFEPAGTPCAQNGGATCDGNGNCV